MTRGIRHKSPRWKFRGKLRKLTIVVRATCWVCGRCEQLETADVHAAAREFRELGWTQPHIKPGMPRWHCCTCSQKRAKGSP